MDQSRATPEPQARSPRRQRFGEAARARLCLHHSTQHVTSRGRSSPARTIHIVLATALFRCRPMVTSMRQWVPQVSVVTATASPAGAASSKASRNHAHRPAEVGCLTKHPSLVPAARMRWIQAIVGSFRISTIARSPFGRCITMPHHHGPVPGLHQQRLCRQKQRPYLITLQACDVLRTTRDTDATGRR